jgi:glutamine amidotransferase
MKIAIINYEMGNVKSVENAFKSIGADTITTADVQTVRCCSAVVLPGVGAFRDAVNNLEKLNLRRTVIGIISENRPFLGICIGLQVLFSYGTEGGKHPGLDVFKGSVEKISGGGGIKIPHMGWNRINILKNESRLFKGIRQDESFYFVHSFHVKPKDRDIVSSVTGYGTEIVSSVEKANCFGVQFHPEKSSICGIEILRNFSDIALEYEKQGFKSI